MDIEARAQRRLLEGFLIVLVIGMAALYGQLQGHGMVALHLFFLPVILSGYYLGRTSAGVLALFCVLSVTVVTGIVSARFVAYDSPIVIGLALTIWAAVLGLIAILMGTLCDERARTVGELQKAYVGVVEVLTKYLQGANPHVKARSTRVAELSQQVAHEMRLPRKEIDNVRVAALLHDLENVEVTTQVMSRAVNVMETRGGQGSHTFLGTDLVHSLGSVLEGALPLLVGQDEALRDCLVDNNELHAGLPMGAQIIDVVRAYDDLLYGIATHAPMAPEYAIQELRRDKARHRDEVVNALARVVQRQNTAAPEPVMA